MASTALATQNGVPALDWSEAQIDLIKRTVAKGATDDEFGMFLHLCRTYQLDPFAKEIWFIKYGGAPTIFTSRDGYLKIANESPHMEGLVSDVVRANDKFVRTPDGVTHEYGKPRGDILGAYALVFRKDRKFPVYVFAPFDEYAAGKNQTWKTYPSAMILKVAEAMALKRAFSISGLVTREEMDARDDQEPEPKNVTPRQEASKVIDAAPSPEKAQAARAALQRAEQPKPNGNGKVLNAGALIRWRQLAGDHGLSEMEANLLLQHIAANRDKATELSELDHLPQVLIVEAIKLAGKAKPGDLAGMLHTERAAFEARQAPMDGVPEFEGSQPAAQSA